MTDLVAAIRAAIDETERIAQRAAAYHPEWVYDRHTLAVSTVAEPHHSVAAKKANGWGLADVDGEHIARHDPAAVLRRCAADRKILDECARVLAIEDRALDYSYEEQQMARYVVETLAEAYGVEA